MRRHHAGILTLLAWCGSAFATPEIAENMHMGVATCASSVCHGKLSPQHDRNVWLNEYRIWSGDDRHARAYQTLLSEESRRMAQNLGLSSAQAAPICLDCHADNVPQDKRGPRFQISDGVGCEACHGGAEQWIESHAEVDATHADNIARGLYPTSNPLARADLCLSCHLGTRDKFATHQIMGAGHPRLSFELEAFTANQPPHFAVDDDYIARKGEIGGFRLWLAGQMRSAGRYLELLQSHLFTPGGLFPDFAFYDCHSCHHPMDDVRWSTARVGPGIAPGTLRLQRQHFDVLLAAAQALGTPEAAQLDTLSRDLVLAGQRDAAAVRAVAARLTEWIAARESEWQDREFSQAEARAVRSALLARAAEGRMSDFAAAEQVFLGIESLSLYLGDAGTHRAALNRLYDVVQTDRDYDPARFITTVRGIQGAF
jgi:hypothetical protein